MVEPLQPAISVLPTMSAPAAEQPPAAVRLRFTVGGKLTHEFVSSPTEAEELKFNLAEEESAVGSASAADPDAAVDTSAALYSYKYTGRHDDGPMPPLKEGGHYARLSRALLDAKARARFKRRERSFPVQSDGQKNPPLRTALVRAPSSRGRRRLWVTKNASHTDSSPSLPSCLCVFRTAASAGRERPRYDRAASNRGERRRWRDDVAHDGGRGEREETTAC